MRRALPNPVCEFHVYSLTRLEVLHGADAIHVAHNAIVSPGHLDALDLAFDFEVKIFPAGAIIHWPDHLGFHFLET